MQNAKIGVPAFAKQISEHAGEEIAGRTLERFLGGEIRTSDHIVAAIARFPLPASPPGQTDGSP